MTLKIRKFQGPLHAGTMDLHHYIEHETELGRVMASGEPTAKQYLAWLRMKASFFAPVEDRMLPECRRKDAYTTDADALAEELGWDVPATEAAEKHAEWLLSPAATAAEKERRATGTIYVCAGSIFGAAKIRQRVEEISPDWPVGSLQFVSRASEVAYINQLRRRGDCVDEARACFEAMIRACEELAAALRGS